jgi:hypothetical protein
MYRGALGCLGITAAFLAGCASERVAEPAGGIASAVAAFQADLSRFQDTTHELQADEANLAVGNDRQRQAATSALNQLQTEQALGEASGFSEMFTILQAQADTHVASLLSSPDTAMLPVSAALPLDKLGAVTKTVQTIAKPPKTRDDLDFLVKFATTTNDDLSALQKPK